MNNRRDYEERNPEPMPRKYHARQQTGKGTWWFVVDSDGDMCAQFAGERAETDALAYAGKLNFIAEGRR